MIDQAYNIEAANRPRLIRRVDDTIKRDVRAITHKFMNVEQKIGNAVKQVGSATVHEIKALPHQIESGALKIGKDIGQLEGAVLPSFNKIIIESLLGVGAVAIIGIVLLKVL